jgi:uncharacterized protein YndB with AHSA1/START domain
MIEGVQQINAVRRRVGRRTLDAGEAPSVIISQVYPAAIGDVWDACTSPDRIARWFVPVTGDLRAGGRFRIEGNASGTIERCDPPRGFTATWEFGGQTSWIELRLSSVPPGSTRLELEHIAAPGDGTWAEFGPGATGVGWDMGLMGLATYLTPGRSADLRERAAWPASGPGREFTAGSSRRWRDADVAPARTKPPPRPRPTAPWPPTPAAPRPADRPAPGPGRSRGRGGPGSAWPGQAARSE